MPRSRFAAFLVPVCLVTTFSRSVWGAPFAAPAPLFAQNNGVTNAPRPIAPDVPFVAKQMLKGIELPHSEAQFGFDANYSPVTGTVWSWQFDPKPEPRAEVERLKKTLKNTDEDAATWLHIGYFRKEAEDTAGAREAYTKAETIFRAQAAQHPQDAAPLQGLGIALSGLAQEADAEKALRDAVKIAPNDAHGMTLLAGQILSETSSPLFRDLTRAIELSRGNGNGKVDDKASADALARVIAWIAPDKLAVTEAHLQEARTLNDLAVALAPRDPLVYMERAGTSFSRYSLERTFANVRAFDERRPTQMTPEARQAATTEFLNGALQSAFVSLINEESQADLERAAQFSSPEEASRLRAMAVFIGILRLKLNGDATPEQTQVIRDDAAANVSEIEKLAQNAQPPSARLWSLLGIVRMAGAELQDDDADKGDPKTIVLRQGAEDAARRALALDEKQRVAWDVLMISVAKNDERLVEMQQLATRRLALDASVSNQFILARNLTLQGKDSEALQQLETALKATPDDWSLRLLRATLLLRQPDDKSLQAAVPLMAELGRMPQVSGSDGSFYNILSGIMLARLHRFYEAELVLSADDGGQPGRFSVPYFGFIADLQTFAGVLAADKRHEDVLAVARVLIKSSVKSPQDYYVNTLGLSTGEYVALTK